MNHGFLETRNEKEFKAGVSSLGYTSFMPLSKLHDRSAGYLVNDTCIIEVKVKILEAESEEDDEYDEGSSDFSTSTKNSSNTDSVKVGDSSVSPSCFPPMINQVL